VRVRIDPSSATPASGQLRDAIATRVRTGRLAPGERIPTVRALAAELGLAPNTVARAYRELEASGHLVGRGRRGTFVADEPPVPALDDAVALEAAAQAFARRVRRLRVSPDVAIAAAHRALGRGKGDRSGPGA
jgi:DNA-binding transcriptional regulator YhcF (GntR family)